MENLSKKTKKLRVLRMDKVNQAVILAGGKGERLKPLTDRIPKPMAPISNRPFLDYLLYSIFDCGIQKVVILTGYKSQFISNCYKDFVRGSVSITCLDSGIKANTGKRIVDAYDLLDSSFLLVYGDTFCQFDLNERLYYHHSKKCPISMTVFSNKEGTAEYGHDNNVLVDCNKMVLAYNPTRSNVNNNGVDIGYFVVDKAIIPNKAPTYLSFQDDILAPLCKLKKVSAYWTDSQYYYITNLQSLNRFEKAVKKLNLLPVTR